MRCPSELPYVDLGGELETLQSALSVSQRVQLESALSYHTLLNPGADLVARIAIGSIVQVPALTDPTTVHDRATEGPPPAHELRVRSNARGDVGAESITRSIRLAHPGASPATTRAPEQFSIPRRIYRTLEKRGLMKLDPIREFMIRRRERAIAGRLPRFPHDTRDAAVESAYAAWGRVPDDAPEDVSPAILFGLHWLQTGGAERWAIESIQIAKDAGFLPIVITDQNSVHPWADRPELEGCVIIILSFDRHEHELDLPLTHALLENFNLKGIVLHHSHLLYQMLPWIKQHRPELPVVDSLHIVEYLGGGYSGESVRFDEFIDTHHVISPQLVEWLTEVQGVDTEKLALAPLTALTVDSLGEFTPRDPVKPFTIAFIGRLSRQKRPDVFLGLVHRLRKQGLTFHAILHGDGEMRSIVEGLIAQFGLGDTIEQRLEDIPVSETLAESDVLVITSINEGLTLTTFEAIAAGIPVISSNVGSQRTIVQDELLFPRPARPFIAGASTIITRLEADEALREQLWTAQQRSVIEFSALPTAHHFMEELFTQWQV